MLIKELLVKREMNVLYNYGMILNEKWNKCYPTNDRGFCLLNVCVFVCGVFSEYRLLITVDCFVISLIQHMETISSNIHFKLNPVYV